MITQERAKELFNYDPKTGLLTWRVNRSRRARVGEIAGTVTPKGYRRVGVDGQDYMVTHVIHVWMTGVWPPDHEDLDPSNDRWLNLRPATTSQQNMNQGIRRDNTFGHKGVHWHKASGKWSVEIQVNGERIHLGLFDRNKLTEAVACYERHARLYHGRFARADVE